ncbi:hypothetical protein HYW17_05175 [Candidatus Uhrbacteria bacterium]|nr:hypothetical protein [Candidatus Uhrbacteria bacterium]
MSSRLANLTAYKGFHNVGKIETKAGVLAPMYPDIAGFLSNPKRLRAVVREMTRSVRRWKPDVIAAPAVRGILLGLPVALALKRNFVFIRPEPKSLHLKKVVEGEFTRGQRVVIVDDGLSTADTKKYVVLALRNAGLEVVGMAVLLDAWQGTQSKILQRKRAWLWKQKFPVQVLVGWADCIRTAKRKKFFSPAFADLMLKYLQDPYQWVRQPRNWSKLYALASKEPSAVLHQSFHKLTSARQ